MTACLFWLDFGSAIDYVYVCLCRMVGMCVYSFYLAAVYDPYCITRYCLCVVVLWPQSLCLIMDVPRANYESYILIGGFYENYNSSRPKPLVTIITVL